MSKLVASLTQKLLSRIFARFPTNTPLITPIAYISRAFGNQRENRLLLGDGLRVG
ncbi:hypothetical protein H6G91_31170 [Nostoc muscorum FACHB-395]|nr:hypothetical protein [Desmonostoc muscorum FACHB-395]